VLLATPQCHEEPCGPNLIIQVVLVVLFGVPPAGLGAVFVGAVALALRPGWARVLVALAVDAVVALIAAVALVWLADRVLSSSPNREATFFGFGWGGGALAQLVCSALWAVRWKRRRTGR
jgi:hypothetical protein